MRTIEISELEIVKHKDYGVCIFGATRGIGIYVVTKNDKNQYESFTLFNTDFNNFGQDNLSLKYKLESYLLQGKDLFKILKFKKYNSILEIQLRNLQKIFNENRDFLLKLNKIRNNDFTRKTIKSIKEV